MDGVADVFWDAKNHVPPAEAGCGKYRLQPDQSPRTLVSQERDGLTPLWPVNRLYHLDRLCRSVTMNVITPQGLAAG